MAKYNKALVALGTAVVAVATAIGFHVDPAAVAAVEGAISTLLVFLVPNATEDETLYAHRVLELQLHLLPPQSPRYW